MGGTEFNLSRVPETLLLPLWGRAQLTRAGSPILRDEAAVALVEQLDYDFSKLRADLDYSKNLAWLARARQFDDKLRGFLAREPEGTLVNLGAGLDTTFSRVDNGKLRWFDLDLPEVIDIRKTLIPETERSTCVAASVLEPGWMEPFGGSPARVMLLAGGLLFYFKERQVMDLFRELGQRLPGVELVFDAMTPACVKRANEMLRNVGMEMAMMEWGLTDAKVMESWGVGVRVVEQFEYFRDLDLTNVPFKARLMTVVNRVFGAMTIVHCRFGRTSSR